MKHLRLSELWDSIEKNQQEKDTVIQSFNDELRTKSIHTVRIRPKDSTERRILESFIRK